MTIRIPKLTPKHFFGMFLILFWGQDIIFSYARAVLIRIPYIKYVADYVIPTLMLICLLFAFPYFVKSISWRDSVFTGITIIVFLMNILLFPENEALIPLLENFFVKVFPLYFIGLAYDEAIYGKTLFIMSIINILAYTLYYVVLGNAIGGGELLGQNSFMNRAYVLLPQLLVVIGGTFKKPELFRIAVCVWGGVLLLMCGNRGSVLLTLLFLAVCVFFISGTKKRFRTYGVIILASLVIMSYFEGLVLVLMTFFERLGVSIRVLSRFLDGTYFQSNGRDTIIDRLSSAIGENPLVGYGLASDRTIAGSYAHNYAFELWTAFGVVIGSVLLAATGYLILAAWKKSSDKTTKVFLLMLVCVGFLKLFISSSFLEEGLFFMLLGYCVGLLRKNSQSHLSKAGDVNENL